MTETTKKPVSVAQVSLTEKLSDIQQKLKAPKNQRNNFGNYNYRNCEDILEAVKPLLGTFILTLNDEIVQIGDRYYVKATATISRDVDAISTTAFARESIDKKGMDDAQITGAASSYARKYALNGLFCIDDTKDADTQDNSVKATTPVRAFTPTTPRVTPTPAVPTTPKAPVTPTTPTTPVANAPVYGYPASASQLAWVDKLLKGRKEREMITDEQLKKLNGKDASAFISSKLSSKQLFELLGVEYKKEVAPKTADPLEGLDLSFDSLVAEVEGKKK